MQEAFDTLCLVPGPLPKKDAIAIFKSVNHSSVSDYDKHEMNRYEFVKAMELVAKRIGIEIEEMLFAKASEGTNLSQERERKREEEQKLSDAILAQVRDLSDLNIQMMKEILKIFVALSDGNAVEPVLDMDKFVDVFVPILNQSEREVQMLFMKIDVNSDGVVSWNEFSTFVLNYHAKVRQISWALLMRLFVYCQE